MFTHHPTQQLEPCLASHCFASTVVTTVAKCMDLEQYISDYGVAATKLGFKACIKRRQLMTCVEGPRPPAPCFHPGGEPILCCHMACTAWQTLLCCVLHTAAAHAISQSLQAVEPSGVTKPQVSGCFQTKPLPGLGLPSTCKLHSSMLCTRSQSQHSLDQIYVSSHH